MNIGMHSQVNMIKEDGQVIHFNNPKVQASLAANTFAVTGHAENKRKLCFNMWHYCQFLGCSQIFPTAYQLYCTHYKCFPFGQHQNLCV